MAKFRFVEWLLFWLQENQNLIFEWDIGNQTKSSNKHGVEVGEIEEVFRTGLTIPLGVQISPSVDEERLGVIGPTFDGRLLHIVFTLRDGRVRAISGRPAHRKEKMEYGEILRKISKRI